MLQVVTNLLKKCLTLSGSASLRTMRRKLILPYFRGPRESVGFRVLEICLTYVVYLDEFGHIGPYINRTDPRHNDSPVFGLAGFALPIDQVRGFGAWFFQRKQELLAFEIDRAGKHPAVWEKKGASIYTVPNVTNYAELRRFTFRLFNKIDTLGGFLFHVGGTKPLAPEEHNPN